MSLRNEELGNLDIQFKHLKGPRIGPEVKIPSTSLQKNWDNVYDRRQTWTYTGADQSNPLRRPCFDRRHDQEWSELVNMVFNSVKEQLLCQIQNITLPGFAGVSREVQRPPQREVKPCGHAFCCSKPAKSPALSDVAIHDLDGTSPNLPKVQQEAVWMNKTIQTSFGVTAGYRDAALPRGAIPPRWSPGITHTIDISNPPALSAGFQDLKESIFANF